MKSSLVQFGVYFLVTILTMGCVSSSKYKALEDHLTVTINEKNKLDEKNRALYLDSEKSEQANRELKTRFIDDAQKRQIEHESLVDEKNNLLETMQDIVGALKEEIENKSVQISRMQKALKVEFVGNVYFAQGSSDLTQEGRKIISRIAPKLKEADGHTISVIGHTDNLPPSSRLKKRYGSNWDLSAARALAVVRVLQWGFDIPPKKIKVMGVGNFDPLNPDDGQDINEANRVVEILLVPSMEN